MNIKAILFSLLIFGFCQPSLLGQFTIEGYTFESGNRGYLSQVVVTAENKANGEFISQVTSDSDGKFVIEVPPGVSMVKLSGMKDLFHDIDMEIGAKDASAGKAYVKLQLKRAPGYIFDITIAEKPDSAGMPTNHLRNTLIEVFNNTSKEVVLVLEDHAQPDFKVNLDKGNHYTVMIRKNGYLAKRMEAFVDVEGCILCFEGIGDVRPGVSDNLSEENTMGTLLANVELEKVFEGKSIELQNIYYDLNSAEIRPDAALELDKAAIFLKDNPNITVELGSHTDSRGKANANLDLSMKRAESAVKYLVDEGKIEQYRISAQGYGEADPAVKCGGNCSEEEHARNRRSEIKVLGFIANTEQKSLEKIKYEENFDAMIAELQSEGQVKIPEDGELPEGIEEEVEKEIGEMETEVEEFVGEVETEVEVEMEEAIEEVETEVELEVEKSVEVLETEIEKTVETEVEIEETASQVAISTSEMAVSNDGFTGHKLVVAFKRDKIDNNDPLFTNFSDLSVYKAKAGYLLYMTGSFDSKAEATDLLNKINTDYPNAYIVEFENGVRIN